MKNLRRNNLRQTILIGIILMLITYIDYGFVHQQEKKTTKIDTVKVQKSQQTIQFERKMLKKKMEIQEMTLDSLKKEIKSKKEGGE